MYTSSCYVFIGTNIIRSSCYSTSSQSGHPEPLRRPKDSEISAERDAGSPVTSSERSLATSLVAVHHTFISSPEPRKPAATKCDETKGNQNAEEDDPFFWRPGDVAKNISKTPTLRKVGVGTGRSNSAFSCAGKNQGKASIARGSCVCVCTCVCIFSSHLFWAPVRTFRYEAGVQQQSGGGWLVTQKEGHTVFLFWRTKKSFCDDLPPPASAPDRYRNKVQTGVENAYSRSDHKKTHMVHKFMSEELEV